MTIGPSVSNLSAVDGHFRLLAEIRSRIRTLNFHIDVLGKSITAQRHKEELLELLRKTEDLTYSTYPNYLGWIRQGFKRYGTTREHMERIFNTHITPGNGATDPLEKAILQDLKISNQGIRTQALRTRIELELIYRSHLDWFPIFNTLTVSDAHYTDVFKPGSRAFENYIRRFVREICKSIYGRAIKPNREQVHTYFAVVERGGQTGRLHFHVLHLCRALPFGARDPNIGLAIGDRRIIDSIRNYWPHGFSSPIAVRFDSNDVYGRIGWRWPLKRDGQHHVSLEASTQAQLANYLAKYITKSHKENYRWRTKTSQHFGKTIISEAMTLVSQRTLETHLTSVTSHHHLTIGKITFPAKTVQQEATRELLRRLQQPKKKNDSERLTKLKSLISLNPRPTVVEHLRTLTRTTKTYNRQSSGVTVTKSTNDTGIFEALQAFEAVLFKYGYNLDNLSAGGTTREN